MFRSAEISVYIHPNYHRRGLGRLLVKEMNRIGKQMQFRAIYGKNNAFMCHMFLIGTKHSCHHI